MPESLLDSRSEFDRAKLLLGRWLKEADADARPLLRGEFDRYKGDHSFVAGWEISIAHDGVEEPFDVLVDGAFPYSRIRIGAKSRDVYLKWPHVEPGGLLCLPQRPAPSADIESAIADALSDSITLLERCKDPNFVREELQREFVTYWGRSESEGAKKIRSLLNPTDKRPRRIAVWRGKLFTLVGESKAQILNWLTNIGRTEESEIEFGVFAFLSEPPYPPFADTAADLFAKLQKYAPQAMPLIAGLSITEKATLVLEANSPSGDGLISTTLSPPRNFDGFRKGNSLAPTMKLALRRMRADATRATVERIDPAWVHGRGVNKHQPALQAATALILGCGSLGSQVAARLAQAGVGGILLVDPDRLAAANVGRHALGIDSLGKSKATFLAAKLRDFYPHMRRIQGYAAPWQALYRAEPAVFTEANLIVACLGDWSADGQLGEWYAREGSTQPIVYGWLDEMGVASHAIALAGPVPALSCILGPDGDLRVAETTWEKDGRVEVEPACGTLFQPYGAIDVAQAEALVSRLCIDVLTGSVKPPSHRVYASSTAQLTDAGGAWSLEHMAHRPAGLGGAFEYERVVAACSQCHACLAIQQ